MGGLLIRLFHARTTAHILHLKTKSYAAHKALNDFYDGIIPLADSLAEVYQGDYGIIEDYPPKYTPYADGVSLMDSLLSAIKETRYQVCDEDDTYLQNIIDEIVALINSTKYKLVNLK